MAPDKTLETVEQITYSKLLLKSQNNDLQVGKKYIITDFRTTHLIPNTNEIHHGSIEEIIVEGVTSSKIGIIAYSTLFAEDVIYYDFMDNIAEDSLTSRTGKITFRQDKNGNATNYDFRNVKFRRWKVDCNEWDPNMTYTLNDIAKYQNIIYKYVGINDDLVSPIGISPSSSRNWMKWLDIENYYLYTTIFQQTEVPGYIKKDSLVFGLYRDYFTFSDINGNEKSEWFSECMLKKSYKPYNNIVFIETGNGQSYSNFFLDCFDMTILEGCRDNFFGNKVHGNIIGENAAENTINASFNYNITGSDCFQNTINARVSGNLFQGLTGNIFLGEAVFNNIFSFAQNIIGSDFSFNCVQHEFYYNQISSYIFSNTFKNLINTCTFHHNVLDCVFGETFEGEINKCFFANINLCKIPDNTILTDINGEGNFSPSLVHLRAILSAPYNKRIVSGEGESYFLTYLNATGNQMIIKV